MVLDPKSIETKQSFRNEIRTRIHSTYAAQKNESDKQIESHSDERRAKEQYTQIKLGEMQYDLLTISIACLSVS